MYLPKVLIAIGLAAATSAMRAQAGTLDNSFSGNGYALETISSIHDGAKDIAVRADGKIVVCGTDDTALNNQMLVVRYTSDGVLDPSFSGDGKLIVPIGFVPDNRGNAVLLQPDNMILVAGTENTMDGYRMTVVRLQSNGSLDASFGTNGRATITETDLASEASSMVLLADGSVVLGGSGFDQVSSPLVAKVDAWGVPDSAFTAAATAAIGGSLVARVNSLAVLPDGRLLIAGSGDTPPKIMRLLADGTSDTSFGTGGSTTIPVGSNSVLRALKLRDDGRIVGAGYRYDGSFERGVVFQLEESGALDPSFGDNGVATFSTAEYDERFTDLEPLPDGQLVTTGYIWDLAEGDFTLRRLDAAGVPVSGFGTDGMVISNFTVYMDLAECMTVQTDGKLLVAGSVSGPIEQFAVARYNMDGGIGWEENLAAKGGGLHCSWGSAGLIVTTTLPVEDARFTVCDAHGALVVDAPWNNIAGRGARILPRALSPGVYFSQVKAASGRQACTFVVPPE